MSPTPRSVGSGASSTTRPWLSAGAAGSEGFETGLGAWSVPGPPAGSPTGGVDFQRAQGLLVSAVTTEDSVLFGFGLEQIASAAERADVVRRAMAHLLGGGSPAAAVIRQPGPISGDDLAGVEDSVRIERRPDGPVQVDDGG